MTIMEEHHKALESNNLKLWSDFLKSRDYITKSNRCNICGKQLNPNYAGNHFTQFKKIKPEEHERVVDIFYSEQGMILKKILKNHGYRLLDADELPAGRKEIREWVIRDSRLYTRTFTYYFKDITEKIRED